ncbi:MAG: hypothetical protein KA369_03555 [Spirochaetes bacterium]|nr:hypothetical protein [Spirochaetota bacterium]
MAQTTIVIIIIALAVVSTAVKLYRFFKPKTGHLPCSPDACASCPFRSIENCGK